MAKMLSLLAALIALVAFAVPTFARAAPAVTDPPGTLLSPGALLQSTNIGSVTTETSLGNLTCGSMSLTTELTSNTGTTVNERGIGEGSATTCSVGGKAVSVTDITLKEKHSATTGKGTLNLTFVVHFPFVTCHFEVAVLPFIYNIATKIWKMIKGDLKGSPAACEPGFFTGEFEIETDGGGSVILD